MIDLDMAIVVGVAGRVSGAADGPRNPVASGRSATLGPHARSSSDGLRATDPSSTGGASARSRRAHHMAARRWGRGRDSAELASSPSLKTSPTGTVRVPTKPRSPKAVDAPTIKQDGKHGDADRLHGAGPMSVVAGIVTRPGHAVVPPWSWRRSAARRCGSSCCGPWVTADRLGR